MTWSDVHNTIDHTYKFFRMTLLLGPPASGKTTLLLALAGKLDKELQVEIFFFPSYILVDAYNNFSTSFHLVNDMGFSKISGFWEGNLQWS